MHKLCQPVYNYVYCCVACFGHGEMRDEVHPDTPQVIRTDTHIPYTLPNKVCLS